MALWRRMVNVFRGERLNRELDEEMEAHIAEAIAQGRDPVESRRVFGSAMRHREESRDAKLIGWLDSLRSDAIFGLRQLNKNRLTSVAAILSLALAMGACTSAFRLIDAMLLRPLPVANPERLYVLGRKGIDPGGHRRVSDFFEYPLFRQMRPAVKGKAELLAISGTSRVDVTYRSDEDEEKANFQFVSGWMFEAFGLRPALGRLLTEGDDLEPNAHAYAVLSYDYWTNRFGRDASVVGRSFRMGTDLYQIVGVAPKGFLGTETGSAADIFVPTMMYPGVSHSDWSWFRTFVKLNEGIAPELVRDALAGPVHAFDAERAKGFGGTMPPSRIQDFLNQTIVLEPAAAGVSWLQHETRDSLKALGILVAFLLLIACVNVANLMTAQAAARAREMALRISIGAGRWRLVQLVLVESAWLALFASLLGALFAWWSAPFVVAHINPPDDPVRLALPADWRVLGFGAALTAGVILLFGLIPALQASGTDPIRTLKSGGEGTARWRLTYGLTAVQVAFCFLVLFAAGLFVATFRRLAHQDVGFSAERVLTLDVVAKEAQPAVKWQQMADGLRAVPGVESAALAGWPLLSGMGWNGFICINDGPPSPDLAYFLDVSPGWMDTMKVRWIEGRDFRRDDGSQIVGIVTQSFAKRYFNGENPLGKWFEKTQGSGELPRIQIVGVVGDVRYRNLREPITPTVFVPFQSFDAKGANRPQKRWTFFVRTRSANSAAATSLLRQELAGAGSGFYISSIRTQEEINDANTVRERLLAMLAVFFAGVAVVLAGVGLYGVLHYSVLRRRREIGIRMAIGARGSGIARLVTVEIFSMVAFGAIAGLGLGMASARFAESLFYRVKATDWTMITFPWAVVMLTALVAAVAPVIRAVRIDPVEMLRVE
ncbi:MAG TPA: ABC transporter permease [Candidatus Methylomirabilis sp.]|nr:ABC transporter permease [Candidatus Methylomirabilis sp.]